MADSNRLLIERAFRAWSDGDVPTLAECVEEDFVWTFLDPMDLDAKPQTCHGRAELEARVGRFAQRGLHIEIEELTEFGERSVVVTHTPGLDAQRLRQANDRNFSVVTLRDGKIVALRACRDRDEATTIASGSSG